MTHVIPIMHCFDNRYVIPAAVSFQSMLENADPNYEYRLYVLHTDISRENQNKLQKLVEKFKNASLEFINMQNRFDDVFENLKIKGHYSKEVLYKLLCPSIFPQYSKIILTDVDVVFKGDISLLWKDTLCNKNFYCAGVKMLVRKGSFLEECLNGYKADFTDEEIKKLTLCGGLLVFNLKQMRENDVEKRFLDVLSKNVHRLHQCEQDVINLSCPQAKKIYFPLNYLVCTYAYELYEDKRFNEDKVYAAEDIEYALANPIQVHYATSVKPWNTLSCTKSEWWYEILLRTSFYYEHMNNLNNMIHLPKITTNKSKWKLFHIPLVTVRTKNATVKSVKFLGISLKR